MATEAANRPEAASAGEAPTAVRPARMIVNELAKPTKADSTPAEAGWTSEPPEGDAGAVEDDKERLQGAGEARKASQ